MNVGKLGLRLQVDPPGVLDVPARQDPHIVVHLGPPVAVACERGGQRHSGLSIHGDIDIVPVGVASRWILKKRDCALVVRLSQDLLMEVAASLDIDPAAATLINRFQLRDPMIENLAWALKAEMDHGFKNGQLYTDSIGAAMACQLLRGYSMASPAGTATRPGTMPPFRLRRVLAHIEDNLSGDLSLSTIASISGLSLSHCQRAFARATGLSVHQYVIQRRVERAKELLVGKGFSLSQVALAVGFSHQSHLAYHMRRLLGVSPTVVRRRGE